MADETNTHCERLSALDTAFLSLEEGGAHMHVGAVCIFDAGPLSTGEGGIDFGRMRDYVCGQLDSIPRYRQRLAWVPLLRHPVWVDDEHFNIGFHLRHTRLPAPGSERQLKRLVGRIFGQRLDRTRPLWELWVVEGLEGNRFALIAKAHHAMVDGVAGVELLTALLRLSKDDVSSRASEFEARSRPRGIGLLRRELEFRVKGVSELGRVVEKMAGNASGLMDMLRRGTSPATPTSLNPRRIGPHRRFDWAKVSLADVKIIRAGLGGKVNDVILAIVTEALRRHHMRHGETNRPERPYRAMLPVNTVRDSGGRSVGNHVALMLAQLPIDEEDPRRRIERIVEETTYLKEESRHVEAASLLEEFSDLTSDRVVAEVFRTATRTRPYNIVVTNIPGPPLPLYFLGAKLDQIVPMVPLFGNQALGVAVFSYAGDLYFGLNADWAEVKDLFCFAEDIESARLELLELTTR